MAIRLEEVVSGLMNPLHLSAPAGDARLFVVEQPGRIRIVKNGSLLPASFLDISNRVRSGGEQGLLSVAFHPRFAQNGYFYVNYTDLNGDTRVERYTAAPGADVANQTSDKLILTIAQPYSNHNGGLVVFGEDGMLYIGMGDGGSGGDPHGHGQDRATLLGDLLRINVDAGDPYSIPADNPFRTTAGVRPEMWASGLRNPWRFAFDQTADLLYVADVGQNAWEEINVVSSRQGGLNYGWNTMEGTHCFASNPCDRQGLTLPALEYDHSEGCSVTGGYVYRGQRISGLAGHYFYSDYCRGWIRSFRFAAGAVADQREWPVANVGNVLSFGEDAVGELYVLSANGKVYRIAPVSGQAR
ncbi:MAG: sorbosone dehydrogenase family protein [Gemmatimonadaceae bacterium]